MTGSTAVDGCPPPQRDHPQEPPEPKHRKLSVIDQPGDGHGDVRTRQQQLRRKSVVGKPRKSPNVASASTKASAVVPNVAQENGEGNNLCLLGKVPRPPRAEPEAVVRRSPLPSVVALPPEVEAIDPEEDHFFAHWPEFIKYAK